MNPEPLPTYRPLRKGISTAIAPPISAEMCGRLIQRWQFEALELDKAAVRLMDCGGCAEDVANVRNVSHSYERCARELSNVVKGLGVPPLGIGWPEAIEDL